MDKRKNSSDVRTRQTLHAFHTDSHFQTHTEYMKMDKQPAPKAHHELLTRSANLEKRTKQITVSDQVV